MKRSSRYLEFQGVTLGAGGKSLTLTLGPGDRYAVTGRSGSGIEEFVAVAAKRGQPASGSVAYHGKPNLTSSLRLGARSTPASLAKPDGTTRSAGVLGLLGLWDDRNTPCSRLGWRQLAACRLVPALSAREGLWVVDGELDQVDLRVAEDVCAEFQEPAEHAKAYVVATNSAVVVERIGSVIVTRNQGVVFAGTVQELVRQSRPSEVTVETSDPGAVAAMADPFALSIRVEEGQMVISSLDGQALAASLLTQGYGSVRSVVVRQPSVARSLLELV